MKLMLLWLFGVPAAVGMMLSVSAQQTLPGDRVVPDSTTPAIHEVVVRKTALCLSGTSVNPELHISHASCRQPAG